MFELSVGCHPRLVKRAHPDSPPDQIIVWVQEFIEKLTRRVSRLKTVQSINVDRGERIKLIAVVPEKAATTEEWLKLVGEHRVIELQPTDLESSE